MSYANSTSVRFEDDGEHPKPIDRDNLFKVKYNNDRKPESVKPDRRSEKHPGASVKPDRRSEKHPGASLRSKVLSRVFSEDYERMKKKILDPRGLTMRRWNKIFLVACLVSLFVDPLFLYLPSIGEDICIEIGSTLKVSLTVIRSISDVFYMIRIYVKFVTAYVAPSSCVFGRGELVIDSAKIAKRYIKRDLWIDFLAALPIPQLLIWIAIPSLSGSAIANTKNVLRFIIILQYIPRLYLIFPLTRQIVEATGVVTETAWDGAAYNLMLYMLASHFIGACWYILSIERQISCWKRICAIEDLDCKDDYFDCQRINEPARHSWFEASNVTDECVSDSDFYQFGIYEESLESKVASSSFFHKYSYCLWFGVRNLSSSGQNLKTSIYVSEVMFVIVIAILGLVLFALLIGNMRTYLQSIMIRLEEWRIKRTDIEQWMHHRQLPLELRQSVRRYYQYKWVATRGVDEESLLRGLPSDLRCDIKRHLCYDLVCRVPLFDQMDQRMLDAICERLQPALCTQGTCLVREGHPVNEMSFIIRGNLDSYTTNGGRTGFFNSCRIGPGDFCGEELLTWALDPSPSVILPSSTRTVKAISEVEAFALIADDLKFVALQYRRLHSKQLRHKFLLYSHQWRTWAACFVQMAWRRYKRRKSARKLKALESFTSVDYESGCSSPLHDWSNVASPDPGYGVYISMMGTGRRPGGSLKKPAEPDFSIDEE